MSWFLCWFPLPMPASPLLLPSSSTQPLINVLYFFILSNVLHDSHSWRFLLYRFPLRRIDFVFHNSSGKTKKKTSITLELPLNRNGNSKTSSVMYSKYLSTTSASRHIRIDAVIVSVRGTIFYHCPIGNSLLHV